MSVINSAVDHVQIRTLLWKKFILIRQVLYFTDFVLTGCNPLYHHAKPLRHRKINVRVQMSPISLAISVICYLMVAVPTGYVYIYTVFQKKNIHSYYWL